MLRIGGRGEPRQIRTGPTGGDPGLLGVVLLQPVFGQIAVGSQLRPRDLLVGPFGALFGGQQVVVVALDFLYGLAQQARDFTQTCVVMKVEFGYLKMRIERKKPGRRCRSQRQIGHGKRLVRGQTRLIHQGRIQIFTGRRLRMRFFFVQPLKKFNASDSPCNKPGLRGVGRLVCRLPLLDGCLNSPCGIRPLAS